jgi:uncharacterized protein
VFAILLVLLSLPVLLRAQDIPIPPPPTQWVTDTAGFLSTEDAGRINARLRAYEEQTHHQLIVWIGPTTGDDSIEDWGNRAFEQWKVGRKGIDDGLVLFIMPKDRRLRLEVGYGLEDKVPDLLANRIIQETIVPRIRAGDNAGAVEAGIEAIAKRDWRTVSGRASCTAATRGTIRGHAAHTRKTDFLRFGGFNHPWGARYEPVIRDVDSPQPAFRR